MSEPITSAEQFAEALSEVVTRYMSHLEPSAEAQQYGVSMTVTGQMLNISFNKQPGSKPYIQFTLQQQHEDEPDEAPRGFFGGR